MSQIAKNIRVGISSKILSEMPGFYWLWHVPNSPQGLIREAFGTEDGKVILRCQQGTTTIVDENSKDYFSGPFYSWKETYNAQQKFAIDLARLRKNVA